MFFFVSLLRAWEFVKCCRGMGGMKRGGGEEEMGEKFEYLSLLLSYVYFHFALSFINISEVDRSYDNFTLITIKD